MYQGKTEAQLASSSTAGVFATIGLLITVVLLFVTELIKAYMYLPGA